MKFTIAVLVLAMLPALSRAETITVGGTTLEIPAPPGFVRVTPEMSGVYAVQKQTVYPSNEQFLGFIAESERPLALTGEIPDLSRTFSVQATKANVPRLSSRAEFLEVKKVLKEQTANIEEKIRQEGGKLLEKVSKGLNDELDTQVDLSFNQTKMLPVHHESERSLAFSALTTYSAKDESGQSVPFVVASTSTFVYVKGKLIFLYCYAEESGLKWGQEASQKWADAVIKANPSDSYTAFFESLPAFILNGSTAWLSGFLVGIVGSGFVLLKKKFSSKNQSLKDPRVPPTSPDAGETA